MTVRLTIPSKPEYVTTLRLVTAAIANKQGFDIEAVDDLRVCVSEAVNYLFAFNEEISVSFEEEDDRLVIVIEAQRSDEEDDGTMLHRQIMESLMDELKLGPSEIRLIKIK